MIGPSRCVYVDVLDRNGRPDADEKRWLATPDVREACSFARFQHTAKRADEMVRIIPPSALSLDERIQLVAVGILRLQ